MPTLPGNVSIQLEMLMRWTSGQLQVILSADSCHATCLKSSSN